MRGDNEKNLAFFPAVDQVKTFDLGHTEYSISDSE